VLTVTLDKLLGGQARASVRRAGGEIVAVLKAGGGVGATALATQAAAMAAHSGAKVCLADLDLQFGLASVYLDLPEAATVADCMSAGTGLADVDFGSLLAKHRSGASLLAAPRQVTPLEALAPPQTEALLAALKGAFELVVVDLPTVWTAWTNRALQMADRIVVVTQLSVPHMHLLDRQLATLRAQGLEDRNLTLVCNALNAEQTAVLSVKSAERALGRAFDIVAPEDRKLMLAAINQGVEISEIRRGAKLEKAIGELAVLMAGQVAEAPKRRWR
jgi:pilus assembly protein CpaE